MTDADKEQFGRIMQGLAEDKGVQLSASGIALKFAALKSFSIQEITSAALEMAVNKKYNSMPSISDFNEYLGGGSCEDRAEIESAKVWGAISRAGGWANVAFDDPVTQAVIMQGFGGWTKLCGEMLEENHKWFVKDFVKIYGAYSRQKVKHFGLLPGRGVGSPVLIGDKDKALVIMHTVNESEQFKISAASDVISKSIENKI